MYLCECGYLYILHALVINSVSNQRHHQKQCVCVRGVLNVRNAGYFNLLKKLYLIYKLYERVLIFLNNKICMILKNIKLKIYTP